MSGLLLAGDVGGTKTELGLYDLGAKHLRRSARYSSREHAGLETLLDAFLEPGEAVAAAAFGVAGPVADGVVQVTNLPWRIEAALLEQRLGCPVRLLNDLEATAIATLELDEDAFEVLQPGRPAPGNRCVIAAGTGLGQAFLVWDGVRYVPSPSEGGHADLAPRNRVEVDLLQFLSGRQARVSWETVLSGPGLVRIFEFVVDELKVAAEATVRREMEAADAAAVIGRAALAGSCPACVRAVELFVELYGAQAGNLALTTMARGGVYLAGGMAPRLLPLLQRGGFTAAFCAKEPFRALMESIPVQVVLDASAPRAGAARAAADLARQ